MPLEMERKSVEVERLAGRAGSQALLRAEALAAGAGREAVEPLLADARLVIQRTELQQDRIVVEGTALCQAVYRQGEASELRGITARAPLSQVLELPGAAPGRLARVQGTVEHVEARYENGHIVFTVAIGVDVRVYALGTAEVIAALGGWEGIETRWRELDSVKLAADAEATATLRETVALPGSLDARAALMDWAAATVERVEPDLGGVRVKGRVMVETLIASGTRDRPAMLVRYPVAFDQLVSVPDWLAGNVFAEVELIELTSRVEPVQDEEAENGLVCELSLRLRAFANVAEKFRALLDAYATRGSSVIVEKGPLSLCVSASQRRFSETVRGTVMTGEGAPAVGTVIAAHVNPVIAEVGGKDGVGRISGVLEAEVLYLPGGSELAETARAEVPFAIDVPVPLDADTLLTMQAVSADATALMSDRLELKAQLELCCERRTRENLEVAKEITEGEALQHRPGIVICWPERGETPWQLGCRYAIPAVQAAEAEAGGPLVILEGSGNR